MNKFKKFLYYFLYPASLIFTVMSVLFYIASNRLSEDEGTKQYAVLMLLIFAYAMIIALFTLIFRTKKPVIVKTLIHFFLILASLVLILFVFTDAFSTSSSLIILGSFTALYWVAAIPSIIIYNKKAAKENEKQDYQGMFSKKK